MDDLYSSISSHLVNPNHRKNHSFINEHPGIETCYNAFKEQLFVYKEETWGVMFDQGLPEHEDDYA